ncbi:MAG: sigma-70 family RNA polymerase sigma factor [Akkermansiaceae bacterium]
MSTPESSNPTAYVQLLAEHDRYLSGYVYNLIPNTTDAEDVLQDVKVALWQAFDQFEVGTNFGAWSRKVAYYRVMAFRKKKAIENKRLTFSDECLDYLTEQFIEDPQLASDQSKSLATCISRLKDDHKELVTLRYKQELSIEETAAQTEKTVAACYRSLSRIRLTLRRCLNKISH